MGCQPWQLAHPTTPATMYTPTHPPTPHNTCHPGGHQPITALQPTHHATQHPPRHEAPRSPHQGGTTHPYPTTNTTRHNPYPCVPCMGKGTQHTQQGHKGEGRGYVMRSPKGGLSAGIWRQEAVMCPHWGKDSASGHPRAQKPPLRRGTSPPAWDGRLAARGQRRRQLPSSVWT